MQGTQSVYDKWKPILDNQLKMSGTQSWFDGYTQKFDAKGGSQSTQSSTQSSPFSAIAFPIIRRVMASTIAGGSISKEKMDAWEAKVADNKLRHLLENEELKEIPMPELEGGLVSVVPMSAPTGKLFYLDFKYEEEKKQSRWKIMWNKIKKLF